MTQSGQENTEQTLNVQTIPSDVSLNQKVDKLGNFSLNILRATVLIRLVGYGFLILFALDLAAIFIPPQFLNPQWEYQTLGQVVERVAIPLLAYAFIFYGGNYLRQGWESLTLTILSWLSLLVGILFIIAVPLGIINTVRIDTQVNNAIEGSSSQRLEALQQVEDRLNQVTTPTEMQILIQQLTDRPAPPIESSEQLNQAKSDLSTFVTESRKQIQVQAAATKKQRRRALLKQSVKWNLGALISGGLFVTAWQMTGWGRRRDLSSEE